MQFVLNNIADLPSVLALPVMKTHLTDLVDAILEEASKFAGEVLAPLNWEATKGPPAWRMPFATTVPVSKTYHQFRDAGWVGMRAPGQSSVGRIAGAGSPWRPKKWCSANLAFSLCPLLTLVRWKPSTTTLRMN